MIAQLRGKVLEAAVAKDSFRVVLDVQGVGYEIWMVKASEGRVAEGQATTIFISESVTAFDGATTLYGFASKEEKDFFLRIRENVDGMGPKKALECLDKISKSLPDFKRAIIEGDTRILVSIFGFTKKTAEKLVFALKGSIEAWGVTGKPKWQEPAAASQESEAVSGLLNLGTSLDEARELAQQAVARLGPNASTEKLLQESLRLMGSKTS